MDYEGRIEEEKQQEMQAGEQVATIYNTSATRRKKSSAEEYARKICYTHDEYEELKAHNFYRDEMPVNNEAATIDEQIADLDLFDEEGYVSQEEVEHLKSLWKHVG